MNTIFDIIHENIDMIDQNMLVVWIVSNELDEENIALLEDTKIRVFIFCAVKTLLLDDNKRHFIGPQIFQQSLILNIVDIVVVSDLGILIIPLLK